MFFLLCFAVCFPSCSPNGRKKDSFIIKRWYFWNYFLFEFLCLWEKHGNFSLSEYFAAGYRSVDKYYRKKRSTSLVFCSEKQRKERTEKARFQENVLWKEFLSLVFRSWLLIAEDTQENFSWICFIVYDKKYFASIFFAPSSEKEVFRSQLSDNFQCKIVKSVSETSSDLTKGKFSYMEK